MPVATTGWLDPGCWAVITRSQPSSAISSATVRILRSCPSSAGAGTRTSRRVALPADLRRRRHQHRHRRQPGPSGRREITTAARRIESQRVDHGGEPPTGAGPDHRIEYREGVDRGLQIVRSGADHRAQGVRRDDLGGSVVRGGPGGLPGSGRTDQDHQRRVRKGRGDGHRLSVAPSWWYRAGGELVGSRTTTLQVFAQSNSFPHPVAGVTALNRSLSRF